MLPADGFSHEGLLGVGEAFACDRNEFLSPKERIFGIAGPAQ
jgi:hypothetical protein